MSVADSTTLRLQRAFDAPATEVFDAWTNPEVLRRWWAADPSWCTPEVEVDLRVGGAYRLTMEDPRLGTRHTLLGEYREVRRPELLVYTWAWEEQDGSRGPASTVSVSFSEQGGRTTVLIEHSGLPSPDSRERHASGWRGCLENLERQVFTGAAHAT